jgi:fructose-bisphosphate aldolase class 1
MSNLKGRLAKLETLLKPAPKREPGAILFLSGGKTRDEAMREFMELNNLSEEPRGKVIVFKGYSG